jgi:Tfp pilus assembly protein PilZ
MADKRGSNRKIKRYHTTFLCGKDQHRGITSNLSKTGLFIKTRKKFTPGSLVKIILHLDENRKIALRGEIARVNTTSKFDNSFKNGIGIKLTSSPEEYKDLLKDLH